MIDQLAAALRGAPGAGRVLAESAAADVIAAAEGHGVLPLLAERLTASGEVSVDWTAPLVARARRHAAADMVREAELRRLVAAFGGQRLDFLLIKGAHLAYAAYPRPDLRPRVDTDVVVRESDRDRAEGVLKRLGYEQEPQGGGDLIFYQSLFSRPRDGGLAQVVDLHWRLSNPQAFGRVLPWESIDESAVPIERLGAARGPGPVNALLIACVHQVAHHPARQRLIWLEDVRRLAPDFSADTWERFVALAERQQVGAVCGKVLVTAVERLGAPVPSRVLDDPRLRLERQTAEASAAWLDPTRSRRRTVAQDLTLLPTWRQRSKLVWQYLFPSSTYMRSVYAPASQWPLPVLYAQRACRGAWRWLRGSTDVSE